ncbi:MAG TPA: acylphosphatase [Jatrophihabitans sp.]|nr:acylphosphatase [Jatrophihabitans sp.]
MTVRLTAIVAGRVQGVGFRYFVRRRAEPLGLAGTATNLPNGRVEVVAEGPRAACEQLLAALRSEDAPGFVGSVDVTWSAAKGSLRGFRER